MYETADQEQNYILTRITKDPITDCWLWNLSLTRGGYADSNHTHFKKKYGKRMGHQISYLVFNGPIPIGHLIRHKCRSKHCCNPDHLETGTVADNNRDKIRDGTNRYGTTRGEDRGINKLTEQQVLEIRHSYLNNPMTTIKDLSALFKVSTATVWAILHRKTWSHI